jgi:ATPase subunit of ABC transporter with duplicated ATPase domains
MIISHDRSFLDKTCQKTYELSGPRPLEFYNGNYTTYVREKAKKEKILIADFERQQEYIDEQEELINKYRAGSRAGWAKSREKMIDRMDRVDPPLTSKKPRFHFMYSEPNGDRMLYFKEAFIGRKDPLFYISELELHAGQRVGIVGENGVGKSTFLKTILGQIPLLDGFMSRGK